MPLLTTISAIRPRPAALMSTGRAPVRPDEWALLFACAALILLAILGPGVDQSSHHHAFADQRSAFGIPHWMDVLSNLSLAIVGLTGIWYVRRPQPKSVSPTQLQLCSLLFVGMVLTALCSGWYHLDPNDSGLAVDRLGMTMAFSGMLGLAAATRISDRAGYWLAAATIAGGAASVAHWLTNGNVFPWAVLQFGGLALILFLALRPKATDALPISWITVVMIYAIAKLLEQADSEVFLLTNGWVSGHTLKHVVASWAALPVIVALSTTTRTSRKSIPLESAETRTTTMVVPR